MSRVFLTGVSMQHERHGLTEKVVDFYSSSTIAGTKDLFFISERLLAEGRTIESNGDYIK